MSSLVMCDLRPTLVWITPSVVAGTLTVQDTITEKLTAALTPLHLQVMNESHMHSVLPGSESHFKVVIVSEQFQSQPLVS